MNRKNISSGAVWEDKVGYSRAVKIGNLLEISGTTASEEDKIIGINDAYAQTVYILNKIKIVIENEGGSLIDIVRTRIFVTNIDHWQKIGRAHHQFFAEIKPATTMVEVNRLIHPDMLVEIEVTAIINTQFD
ncbi:MAG TPA: RidA family protein [Sphingobacteriaceae bacterium]